jgi:hypothetical protein
LTPTTDRDFIVTGERAALGMLRREYLPGLLREGLDAYLESLLRRL